MQKALQTPPIGCIVLLLSQTFPFVPRKYALNVRYIIIIFCTLHCFFVWSLIGLFAVGNAPYMVTKWWLKSSRHKMEPLCERRVMASRLPSDEVIVMCRRRRIVGILTVAMVDFRRARLEQRYWDNPAVKKRMYSFACSEIFSHWKFI